MDRSIHSRWWDWPAALLLVAALTTAASRLVITKWTTDLGLVQTLAFLGAVAGLALGQSRFSPRLAVGFALAYGAFAVPWQLGLTLDYEIPWLERLARLLTRMDIAARQLAQQQVVLDPLMFLLLVGCLTWMLSVRAGYVVTRHGNAWLAVIPAGVAMLFIQAQDPYVASRAWLFAVYALLALLLVARLTYRHNRRGWRESGVSLPPYFGLERARVVLLTAVLLVLLAWSTPALASAVPVAEKAWRWITRPWDSVGEWLGNAFASLEGAGVSEGRYYGESLTLGQGGSLSNEPVFTVRALSNHRRVIRTYWRARIYDRYTDGQWASTFTATQMVDAGYFDLALPEATAGRLVGGFQFTPTVPIITLYAAPQPLWVSRSAEVELIYNPDGTSDLSALHAAEPVRAGETYAVQSSLSAATITQLRTAGTDYPAWVTERYLQLPANLTPRIQDLADEIAAGQDTPYDVAAAVTRYLRTQIRYVEGVQAPPAGQEPLDWFLFDLREGFCNYYASAEVVLLRSAGVPARLAIGYAEGTRQEQSVYVVSQKDAHAWPEVYFPGLGWVEFEPTVSQPTLTRPLGESEQGVVGGGADVPGEPLEGQGDRLDDRLEELLAMEEEPLPEFASTPRLGSRIPRGVLAGLLLALLVGIAWRIARRRGVPPLPVVLERGLRRFDLRPPAFLRLWALFVTLPSLERAYLHLSLALTRLGAPPALSDTPAERVAGLGRLLPGASALGMRFLAEIHATAYSPRPGDAAAALRAGRAIHYLAWRAVVRERIERLLRPLSIVARRLTSASHHSLR